MVCWDNLRETITTITWNSTVHNPRKKYRVKRYVDRLKQKFTFLLIVILLVYSFIITNEKKILTSEV
jgi:hypothetical protein